MFNLYMLKYPGQPFPKKEIGQNIEYEKLEKDYGFSTEEIDRGIEGDLIRDQFILELTPYFMQCITETDKPEYDLTESGTEIFSIWLSGNPESKQLKGRVLRAIGAKLNIDSETVRLTIKNALNKLKKNDKHDDLLNLLTEYYKTMNCTGIKKY